MAKTIRVPEADELNPRKKLQKENAEKLAKGKAAALCKACSQYVETQDDERLKALRAAYRAYMITQRGKLPDEPRAAWKAFNASNGIESSQGQALNHLESFRNLIFGRHKLEPEKKPKQDPPNTGGDKTPDK